MGQVLHGSATTTEAVRRAIQHSQVSLRTLTRRYGINQKTVAKWKKRTAKADLPTGPKVARSTVLSIEEEAVIVAFRRHTQLPVGDASCLQDRPGLPVRSVQLVVAAIGVRLQDALLGCKMAPWVITAPVARIVEDH